MKNNTQFEIHLEGYQHLKNCCLILHTEWQKKIERPFFKAHKRVTDNGMCCHIVPHLDFKDREEGNEPEQMTSYAGHLDDLNDIPMGASAGVNNGLSLLLDAETFDYEPNYYVGEVGFKLAVADARDVPFIGDMFTYFVPGYNTNKQKVFATSNSFQIMYIFLNIYVF